MPASGDAWVEWARIEPILLVIARLVVGAIFLLAGITKIGSPGAFADAVRAYHILPGQYVIPLAYGLPWIEILAALYFIVGFMSRVAAVAVIAMLAMFEYALVNSLVTGNTHHTCGCFGNADVNPILAFIAGGNTVTLWDVARDLILVALAVAVLIRGAGPFSIEALFKRS